MGFERATVIEVSKRPDNKPPVKPLVVPPPPPKPGPIGMRRAPDPPPVESPPDPEKVETPEAAAPPPRKFIFSPRVPPTLPAQSSKTAVLAPPAPAKSEKKRETAPPKPAKPVTVPPPVVRYDRRVTISDAPTPAPPPQEPVQKTDAPPAVEMPPPPRRRVEPPVMAFPKKTEPTKPEKKSSNGKRVSESKKDEPKPAVEPAAPSAPQHSEGPVDSISASKAQSESPQPSASSLKFQASSLKPQSVVAKRAVEKKKQPKEKKREKPDRPGFFRRLANRFTVEEIEPLPDVTKPELPEKTSTEPIVVEVKPAVPPQAPFEPPTKPVAPKAAPVKPTEPAPRSPKVVTSVSTPPSKPSPKRSAEPLNLKDDLLPTSGESIGTWKILVTGGGGFLGKAIIEQLHARGLKVRSFSRSDYHELRRFGTEHFRGDLACADSLKKAVAGCDIVFHTAALAGVWGPYSAYHKANVIGTQNVIDACRVAGVKRLIYTSSPSVVFDGSDMQGIDETAPYPTRFHANYPKTKALAEQMVLAANDAKLATVSLRPHLIWGPGDHHLVPRILARARSLRIIGGANKKVDSVYIDNAADVHLLAAGRLRPDSPIAGKAYFITNGEPRPMWDLVNGILAAGKVPPVTRGVSRGMAFKSAALLEFFYSLFGIEGEPRLTRFVARELTTAHWFDITAARRDLNYAPHVTIDEGLSRLAAWLSAGGAKMLRGSR